MSLYDRNRAPVMHPADAVFAVHGFLERCRGWGTEREIPKLLARLTTDPSPEDAAKLHAWTSWVTFVDHALAEIESGHLDPWFTEHRPPADVGAEDTPADARDR